jgi:hypothetical protein
MREAIGTLAGMAATFVIGWIGRGKWERYPWNAKPQRWRAYPDSEAFWRAEVDIEKELRGGWPPR